METLAIVFAILALVFVIDLGRGDFLVSRGMMSSETHFDISAVGALVSVVAAVTFGILAVVL